MVGNVGFHRITMTYPFVFLVLLFAWLAASNAQPSQLQQEELFRLHILHGNDQHGHFQPFTQEGTFCLSNDTQLCVGGAARRAQMIADRKAELAATTPQVPVLLTDSGDVFQGTLFYNFYKGNASAAILKAMQYEAFTLGNHEFDDGLQVLQRFVESIHMDIPVVCANIEFPSTFSRLQSLIQPYLVKTYPMPSVNNHSNPGVFRMAITGVVTEDLPEIAILPPGIRVFNIVDTLNRLASQLIPTVADAIVVLSHAGVQRDLQVAAQTRGISLILGGHSHTKVDPPIAVTNRDGHRVYVGQAQCWGFLLGEMDVTFNRSSGYVTQFHGKAVPIVPAAGPSDPVVAKIVNDLMIPLEGWMASKRGNVQSGQVLDGDTCRMQECSLGNMVADALAEMIRVGPSARMLHYDPSQTMDAQPILSSSSSATISSLATSDKVIPLAMFNSGTIRASLRGDISMADIFTVFPFPNTYVAIDLNHSSLATMLSFSASRRSRGSFLQVSSRVHVQIDPNTLQLISFTVDGDSSTPPSNTFYRVMVSTYMLAGGDGYGFLDNLALSKFDYGYTLADIMAEYIETHSPIVPQAGGRIVFATAPPDPDPDPNPHNPPDRSPSSSDDDDAAQFWSSVGGIIVIVVIAVVASGVLASGAYFAYRKLRSESLAMRYRQSVDAELNGSEWDDHVSELG
jgi:5'-nucleotidase